MKMAISLGIGILSIATALTQPTHADVAGIAPFVGGWNGAREGLEINADGGGSYHYRVPCDICSMADTPYGETTFALTSVSGNAASGTVTADTHDAGRIGGPISITLNPASGGPVTIDLTVSGKAGPLMCPRSQASWCGG